MAVASVLKKTPRPVDLRDFVLSVFVVGLGVGFVALLSVQQALFATSIVTGAAAAAAGAALAGPALHGRPAVSRWIGSAHVWPVVACCSWVVWLGVRSFAPEWAVTVGEARLFFLGLAIGACSRLAFLRVASDSPTWQAREVLSLGGVSFATGGAVASLLGLVSLNQISVDALEWWAASVPALAVWLASRDRNSGRSQVGAAAQGPADRPADPSGVLVAASLLGLAVAWGAAACGLPIQASRGAGAWGAAGAAVLSLLWVGACVGWSASRSPSRPGGRPVLPIRPLVLAAAGSCALLVQPPWWAAAPAAALLGAGFGMLARLVLAYGARSATRQAGGDVPLALPFAVPAGLLAAWLTALLHWGGGPSLPVLVAAACFTGSVAAFYLALSDRRMASSAGPA